MLVANIYKEYTYLSQCEIFRYIRARYVIELDVFDKYIEFVIELKLKNSLSHDYLEKSNFS